MGRIEIKKQSKLNPKDTFTGLSAALNNSEELKELDPNHRIEYYHEIRTLKIHGKNFEADLRVGDGSTITLQIEVRGFMLNLAKSKIEKKMTAKLNDILLSMEA